MRILVTGSEGLLGSWTVPALRKAGHKVVTLDIKTRAPEAGARHIAGDLRDVAIARNAVPGMDVVVHLAAPPRAGLPALQIPVREDM